VNRAHFADQEFIFCFALRALVVEIWRSKGCFVVEKAGRAKLYANSNNVKVSYERRLLGNLADIVSKRTLRTYGASGMN
jgi:hypothetical protein